MANETPIAQLQRYATEITLDDLEVHKASILLDERQDGELVTRITLLVNDPGPGKDTWNFDAVRDLKRQLARKATELDLPSTSVTLVPDSQAKLVESFAQ
jgi:hypothetical protein